MKELTPIIAQWRSELREAEQRLDALETARNQMDQARRLMQESIGLLDAVRSDAGEDPEASTLSARHPEIPPFDWDAAIQGALGDNNGFITLPAGITFMVGSAYADGFRAIEYDVGYWESDFEFEFIKTCYYRTPKKALEAFKEMIESEYPTLLIPPATPAQEAMPPAMPPMAPSEPVQPPQDETPEPEPEPTPPTQADPVASTDAETIENALTVLGMTRPQLATAMGVSPSSIRNYLQGKNGIGEAPRAALDKLLAEHSKPSEFPRMIALERVRCARRHVERFYSFDKLSDERWQVEGGERVKLSAEALKWNTVVEVERVKDEQREARARKRRKSMNSY